jgi:hypothetical protein
MHRVVADTVDALDPSLTEMLLATGMLPRSARECGQRR